MLLVATVIGCEDTPETPTFETFSILAPTHQFIDFSGENKRRLEFSSELPTDVSIYNKVELQIILDCPSGGCDPWDRLASLSINDNGELLEIARYITPYGIGCSWTVDVSDYKHLLSGDVAFESYIDTWVKSAWNVSFKLTYHIGEPEHENIQIETIWKNDHLEYGNPDVSTIQPETIFNVDQNAQSVKVKILQTGHGQGNSGNAAEFLPRTHQLKINNAKSLDNNLWKSDCDQNSCSPQNGNWIYSRAGWCPGQAVVPTEFTVTEWLNLGTENNINYVLEDYLNECSPHNIDCDTSICPDCAYNNTGHTKPFYKLAVQLITYY